jgi:hypothetical protein
MTVPAPSSPVAPNTRKAPKSFTQPSHSITSAPIAAPSEATNMM